MSEKFIDSICVQLNDSCSNKENQSFVRWTNQDVNLDITKCRKHCVIAQGYVWNGVQICESCDKILHNNLDKLNKPHYELILNIIQNEEKIKSLQDNIKTLYGQINVLTNICDDLTKNFNDTVRHLSNDIVQIKTSINNNDNKYVNMINKETKFIDEINNKLDDFINIFDNKVSNIVDSKLTEFNNNINNNNINNINKNNNNINNNNDINNNNINKNNNNKNNNNNNNKSNKNNNIIDIQPGKLNVNQNNNNNNNNLDEKYANIKVFDKHKIGGIGYVLTVNTVTPGKVKRNYKYTNDKGTVSFRIKDFNNNCCPIEFEYPDSQIYIIPEFIKGNYNMIDIFDEFYKTE
jgi:hypothetical protein